MNDPNMVPISRNTNFFSSYTAPYTTAFDPKFHCSSNLIDGFDPDTTLVQMLPSMDADLDLGLDTT